MTTNRFKEPRITINRVYTKLGDSGKTKLVGGQKVSKGSLRLESYGTVDELNAFVGMALITLQVELPSHPNLKSLENILIQIQHELFNLGGVLATLPQDIHPRQPQVSSEEVLRLESYIDQYNEDLPPLKSFVLPGGCRLNVDLHLCRTVCRRAERHCVRLNDEDKVTLNTIKYLNRLSDAFFVWSRWVSHELGIPETLWNPNRSSSKFEETNPPIQK